MMPALITFGSVVLLVGVYVIANYNRMARVRQHIRESWSDIDVELKRRYELIPNLVETGNKAQQNHGSAASQALDESALLLVLRKLFALVERYPTLKADANFLALQKELANTEDRVAASRRFYNANIREMSQLCETIPTNFIASMFGFVGGDYFELDSAAERVVPRVEL